MLELTISESNGKHILLKDKLENLTIAKKIIVVNSQAEPILKEGTKSYIGFDEIHDFLEAQELFIKQWYECRCGNHGPD